MVKDLKNPFTPGTAAMPRDFCELARRRSLIQEVLTVAKPLCLSKQEKNRAPHSDVFLCGPEGIGKTVLLRMIELELQKEFKKLKDMQSKDRDTEHTILRWTPQSCGTRKITVRATLPTGFWQSIADSEKTFRVAGIRLKLNDASSPILYSALKERLKDGPLVILIDDAQGIRPKIVRDLLDASQQLRHEGNPLLFVIAGTERLITTLNKINRTLLARSAVIRVGPLDEDDARRALAAPLKKIGADPRELDVLLAEANGQPYLLQKLGQMVVQQLDLTKTDIVTDAVASEVLQRFKRETSMRDDVIQGMLGSDVSVSRGYKQLESKIKRLKVQRDKLDTKKKHLEERHRKLEENKKRIRAERADLSSDKEQFETRRLELNSDREDIETRREDLDSQKKQLEDRHRDLEMDKMHLERQRADLEKRHTEADLERRRLEARRDEIDVEKKRVEDRRTGVDLEREQLGNQWEKLRLEEDRLEDRREEVGLEKSRLEDERRKLGLEKKNLEGQQEELALERGRLTERRVEMNREDKLLNEWRTEMDMEKKLLDERRSKVEAEKKRLDERRSELDAEKKLLDTRSKEMDLAEVQRQRKLSDFLARKKRQHPRKWRWIFGDEQPPGISIE